MSFDTPALRGISLCITWPACDPLGSPHTRLWYLLSSWSSLELLCKLHFYLLPLTFVSFRLDLYLRSFTGFLSKHLASSVQLVFHHSLKKNKTVGTVQIKLNCIFTSFCASADLSSDISNINACICIWREIKSSKIIHKKTIMKKNRGSLPGLKLFPLEAALSAWLPPPPCSQMLL